MAAVEPAHPVNLAVLRCSVAAVLLVSPETYSAARIAALPVVLRAAPEGLRTAARLVPITPEVARVMTAVLVVATCAAFIGLFTRAALAVVTISGLYVLGVYQLTGSVTHDMHLLWFTALLAAGPSGDALSVDRWLAKRRGAPAPAPSLGAGAVLLFVWILLGLVYQFPGIWKLHDSGLAWITSDNLKYQMYWKWYENGSVPAVRIDHLGGLTQIGALGVVIFELSFLPLVLGRRTRLVAGAMGLVFHALAQALLFIPFMSLWACYTALVDWGRFVPGAAATESASPVTREAIGVDRIRERAAERTAVLAARAPFLVGIALTVAVFVQGARNAVQAWPFGCYPTFQSLAGPTIPDIALEAVDATGAVHMLPDGRGGGGPRRSSEEWGEAWRLGGLYGDAPTAPRLRAYVAHALDKPAVRDALGGARTVRVYLGQYSVVPEDAGRPPVTATLLGEVRLP